MFDVGGVEFVVLCWVVLCWRVGGCEEGGGGGGERGLRWTDGWMDGWMA